MRTRFDAVINDTILLKYASLRNGLRYDIDTWNKIEIYNEDPRQNPSATPIQTILPPNITRESIGLYNYTMNSVDTAGPYYDKQYYIPEVGGAEITDVEYVQVSEAVAAVPPCSVRNGYCFLNYTVPAGTWGLTGTADDMRHHWLYGVKLVAENGAEVQDNQLLFAVDAATRAMERYLGIDIYRRIYKTLPAASLTRTLKWVDGVDYTDVDDPYPFRPEAWRNYGFVQLRHFPLISMERAILYTITRTELFDMLTNDWIRLQKEAGQVSIYPKQYSLPFGPPVIASMGGGWLWLNQAQHQYPQGFEFDYSTGYENSDFVPSDLREIIMKVAAVHLLNWIGDGLLAGFSSSSISIDGLSENFSSTQSATSAYFGARILAYTNELKQQLPKIRFKFSNIPIAFL